MFKNLFKKVEKLICVYQHNWMLANHLFLKQFCILPKGSVLVINKKDPIKLTIKNVSEGAHPNKSQKDRIVTWYDCEDENGKKRAIVNSSNLYVCEIWIPSSAVNS